MTKHTSSVFPSIAAMVLLAMVVLENMTTAGAANCNPLELSPCLPAFTSTAKPTRPCCGKLIEQKPCLCGYLKDPNYRHYIDSPNAKRVSATCGVPLPSC